MLILQTCARGGPSAQLILRCMQQLIFLSKDRKAMYVLIR